MTAHPRYIRGRDEVAPPPAPGAVPDLKRPAEPAETPDPALAPAPAAAPAGRASTDVEAAPADTADRPRRRVLRKLAIAALPLALAAGGGYAWVTGGRYIATEDAYVQQDRVTVMPQVSGQIASVDVAENEQVFAGETLFTIDPAAYRNEVEAAQARLASARLGIEEMKASYQQAVSAAGTAREALATAQTQDERQQALLERGVVPQAQADETALALQRARGALAEAESRVVSARAALAGDPELPTDKHPTVLQALAALHAAELDLEHTTVVAPTDGVVSQTDRLQPGQYVTPATAVLAVVEADESRIEANYKETELTQMAVGQPATVALDAWPDARLTGEVASIGAGTGSEFALLPAQNATGNWVKVVQRVPVRIRLAEGQTLPPMRAGMSTEVTVDTGQARGLPNFLADGLDALGIAGPAATAAPDSASGLTAAAPAAAAPAAAEPAAAEPAAAAPAAAVSR